MSAGQKITDLRPMDERTRHLRDVAALERDLAEAQRIARAAAAYRAAILARPKQQKQMTRAHRQSIARAWLALCNALDEQGTEAIDPAEVERLRDVDAIAGEVVGAVESIAERQRLRPMEWGASRVLDELAPSVVALRRARTKDADETEASSA